MTNNHLMHESSHNLQYAGLYLQRWNETKYTHTFFFLIYMSISSCVTYLTAIVTM